MSYFEPEENIANWVQDPPPKPVKPAMYRSKYAADSIPTASTFGLQGTTRMPGANRGESGNGSICVKKDRAFGQPQKHQGNTSSYLRKSGKDNISKDAPAPFVRPLVKQRKPPVPGRGEKPVMGLQTTKNFLVANAVENILAVPKKVSEDVTRFTEKPGYGSVPEYLSDVKAAIEEEKQVLKEYLEEEQVRYDDGPKAVEMPEDERQALILSLKKKWDACNAQYQLISHQTVLDTINKLRKKEAFEAQLENLERTIERLESYQKIYVQT